MLLFVIGVTFGSFLNVLIDRLSTGRNFTTGRSYCEHCKKTLSFYELIPLISFVFLRGKCKKCHVRIPTRLFIVELLSGLFFAGLYLYSLVNLIPFFAFAFLLITLWSYLGIFFADLEYGIIPDLLVGISVVAALVYIVILGQPLVNHLLAGLGAFVFFLVLFLITKGRGMGLGDVKLSFSLGLLLGFPLIIVALYVAFLTGAGVSIILVVWKKLRFFGGTIPFGPFLIGGTFIALFWGTILLQMFTNRLMP